MTAHDSTHINSPFNDLWLLVNVLDGSQNPLSSDEARHTLAIYRDGGNALRNNITFIVTK